VRNFYLHELYIVYIYVSKLRGYVILKS